MRYLFDSERNIVPNQEQHERNNQQRKPDSIEKEKQLLSVLSLTVSAELFSAVSCMVCASHRIALSTSVRTAKLGITPTIKAPKQTKRAEKLTIPIKRELRELVAVQYVIVNSPFPVSEY